MRAKLSWVGPMAMAMVCVLRVKRRKRRRRGRHFISESDRIGRIAGVVPVGIQQDWTDGMMWSISLAARVEWLDYAIKWWIFDMDILSECVVSQKATLLGIENNTVWITFNWVKYTSWVYKSRCTSVWCGLGIVCNTAGYLHTNVHTELIHVYQCITTTPGLTTPLPN